MSAFITRRRLITTGLVTGAASLGVASRLADKYGLIPPDHDGIYGAGETLTYAAHRLLMSCGSFAREFDRTEISKVARVNGAPPRTKRISAYWLAVSWTGGSRLTAWSLARLPSLSRN